SAGARTALGPRLRAARLPAPLWLLGTNSGQSHDAGAARSASLPGAGGGSPPGRLQPRGTFLGKVETPGGVQLPKAPPALKRKGGCGSALLPENLANFGQILPTWGESSGWPGA
ncbi:hypothetical protein LEMLEM_LOCUS25086, partial [Lemmus lemmus]